MTTPVIQLNLTAAQFLVIHEFLWNTKLGDNNIFEKEISDLVIELDCDEVNEVVLASGIALGYPGISADTDEEDGSSVFRIFETDFAE